MTDIRTAQRLLNANGFPCGAVDGIYGRNTKAAIERFQRAHAIIGLEVTGKLDAATAYAIEMLPRLSQNFTVSELRSKGDGTCYVRRELLWALETFRAWLGKPLILRSAYRDPAHNKAVGGASRSLHVFGAAADFDRTYQAKLNDVRALQLFSGIGARWDTGYVTHVDVRHRIGRGYSTAKPSIWSYR